MISMLKHVNQQKNFFRFYLGVRDIMAFSSQMTSVLWSDVTTTYYNMMWKKTYVTLIFSFFIWSLSPQTTRSELLFSVKNLMETIEKINKLSCVISGSISVVKVCGN